MNPKRIMVAPLNWGLGHASRCIPLIRLLEQEGASVFLASSDAALALLTREFPHLPYLELPDYQVRYPSRHMSRDLALQSVQIGRAILGEHRATTRAVNQYRLTGILSDNRLGCYSNQVPSVCISHQTNLHAEGALVRWVANQLNHFYLSRFQEVWIPDYPPPYNLSGNLSHPRRLSRVRHIGWLTRMTCRPTPVRYDLAMVLSGPEPQRSILEEKLLHQVQSLPYRAVLVRGLPPREDHEQLSPTLEAYDYLPSEPLNQLMSESGLIICRSGYSTLMDLAFLRKKALLIPTPGQPEQEYLADWLSQKNLFYSRDQDELDLEKDIPRAMEFPAFSEMAPPPPLLEQTVREWLVKN